MTIFEMVLHEKGKLVKLRISSGAPPTFTTDQLTMIFAISCEAVEDSGRISRRVLCSG